VYASEPRFLLLRVVGREWRPRLFSSAQVIRRYLQMDIREIQPSEIEAARRLLCDNGWAHRVADVESFRQLIAKSQRAVVAVENGAVLGFARAICDDQSNGYLSMVVVDEHHRRKGVGRALVHAVMGDDTRITWLLRAGRAGATPFFAKLGFVPSQVAMERNRAHRTDPDNRREHP
jgi:GNAT superfamily N-acetyltransferase